MDLHRLTTNSTKSTRLITIQGNSRQTNTTHDKPTILATNQQDSQQFKAIHDKSTQLTTIQHNSQQITPMLQDALTRHQRDSNQIALLRNTFRHIFVKCRGAFFTLSGKGIIGLSRQFTTIHDKFKATHNNSTHERDINEHLAKISLLPQHIHAHFRETRGRLFHPIW